MSAWSWRDVILYGPGLIACIGIALVHPIDRWHYRRTKQQYEERWGAPYDGP